MVLPGCADFVILPVSFTFCKRLEMKKVGSKECREFAYFESVDSASVLIQCIHEMHGQ